MKSRRLVVVCGWLMLTTCGFGWTAGPDEIKDAHSLVKAYQQAEKLKKDGKERDALAVYERLVEAAARILTGTNPQVTANLKHNLGDLRRTLGLYNEAEETYKQSLELRKQIETDDPLDKDKALAVAESLNNLALLYKEMGRYKEAEDHYKQSLVILKGNRAKDHLDVATCLDNLGELYWNMARYEDAEDHYKQSLAIREKSADKLAPLAIAQSKNNLAVLYQDMARYRDAELWLLESLKIRQQEKAPLDVAESCSNLAVLYRYTGRFARAEPFIDRCLQIREAQRGADHPIVAMALHNRAELYFHMARYEEAQKGFLDALKILEAKLDKDHPLVAACLDNLASLYRDRRRFADAEQPLQRALKIREAKFGKDHPNVANNLDSLGKLYLEMERYRDAEPHFQRSLDIRKSKLGHEHHHVAMSFSNLGRLALVQGQYERAEPHFQKALAIRRIKLDKNHPEIAEDLSYLAALYEATRKTAMAVKAADEARRISRRHVAGVLPILSEKEQQTFLQETDRKHWHGALSLALSHKDSAALSLGWVLNGKAVAEEALAVSTQLARDSRDPAIGELTRELVLVRQELARLNNRTPATAGQEDAQRRDELAKREREEDLARRLRQAGSATVCAEPWVEVDLVRARLPVDAVLIDLARFDVRDFKAKGEKKQWQPARYAAWIVWRDKPVQVVDLGPADRIEQAVEEVRIALDQAPKAIAAKNEGEHKAEADLRPLLDRLSELVLRPLLPHIDIRASPRWILSPDSNLWLVPWAALTLPSGKDETSYAVEKLTISYVVSSRDLVREPVRAGIKPSAPVVLADPDFDLGLAQVAQAARTALGDELQMRDVRSAPTGLSLGKIPRLPASAGEAKDVAPRLKAYTGLEPRVFTKGQASAGVFLACRQPRVLFVSTHGYALAENRSRAAITSNPLLRCGLLLAGCNRASEAKEGYDNGVLTGLQIVGTDLRGCELVVLSACDTGLGAVRDGEGVAGLRQAFQLAGAESLVGSLWSVADRPTADLMKELFDNLADKQSKAKVLQKAQVKLIEARRQRGNAAHPFFWAAFTLTGTTR